MRFVLPLFILCLAASCKQPVNNAWVSEYSNRLMDSVVMIDNGKVKVDRGMLEIKRGAYLAIVDKMREDLTDLKLKEAVTTRYNELKEGPAPMAAPEASTN